MKQTTKNCIRFLAALIAAFILLDCALAFFYGRYILRSGDFWLNDYELTRRDHPEKVWDKVIFGSSELVAGFRDEESESGYINLGMDYGTIRDLLTMLKKKTITVGSELVLAVDSLCFYDGMDTNPVYPWHRQLYEPYAYFMRDRLNTSLMNAVKRLSGEEAARGLHREQTKAYYEGCLTGEVLDATPSPSRIIRKTWTRSTRWRTGAPCTGSGCGCSGCPAIPPPRSPRARRRSWKRPTPDASGTAWRSTT